MSLSKLSIINSYFFKGKVPLVSYVMPSDRMTSSTEVHWRIQNQQRQQDSDCYLGCRWRHWHCSSAIWSSSTSMWAMSSKWSKPEVRRALVPGLKGCHFVWTVNVPVIPALLLTVTGGTVDPSTGPYGDPRVRMGWLQFCPQFCLCSCLGPEYCLLG